VSTPGWLADLDDVVAGVRAEELRSILLPEEFWTARPYLGHIRQAAHSRGRSADLVFHGVLTRVAGSISHTIKLPPIVGARAPLCYYAVAAGPPASGKSSANAISSELVPVGCHVADQLPIGSGEGLVEAMFDFVQEIDEKSNKAVTVKRQTKFNVVMYVDEGEALAALGGRNGNTTLATLRSIWSGQTLGQANATAERKRRVPAGQYTYGLVLGLQPSLAGPLLADVTAGTPQRFAWAWAIDPTIPDEPATWPGQLEWAPPTAGRLDRIKGLPSGGYVTHEMTVAPAVAEEIRQRDLSRVRGEVKVDSHEAHLDLLRLKVAGLLSILDGRLSVAEADWELAELVTTTSGAVRRHVQAEVEDVARDAEDQTSGKMARRQVRAVAAVEADQVERTARRVITIVNRHPDGITVRGVREHLSRNQRALLPEAVAHAVDAGRIVETIEPGQGPDKRMLAPVKR
jgi:hypothetical protein